MQPILPNPFAENQANHEFQTGLLLKRLDESSDLVIRVWGNSWSVLSNHPHFFALLRNDTGQRTIMPAYFAFHDFWTRADLANPLSVDWVNSGNTGSDKCEYKDYIHYIWFSLYISIKLYDEWASDEATRRHAVFKIFPVFLTALGNLYRHLVTRPNIEITAPSA